MSEREKRREKESERENNETKRRKKRKARERLGGRERKLILRSLYIIMLSDQSTKFYFFVNDLPQHA